MSKLALLSVSDKTGLVEFAQRLVQDFDYQLISSGGTAKLLQAAGLTVTKVSDYTGAPEILGGRVKTLHPKIHGGILARRDLASHEQDLATQGIQAIDLVVVNLYPFEATIQRSDVTLDEAIENIDIGGPTLIRAAAKNHPWVTVLCHPQQYSGYLTLLQDQNGQIPVAQRQAYALAAFEHTAHYDRTIVSYLSQTFSPEAPPTTWSRSAHSPTALRYGENPHQSAQWYQTGQEPSGWSAAQQLQGKELSYNNLVDLEAARRIVAEFCDDSKTPAAVVVKHTNPCGVALGSSLQDAYQRAFNADSTSAFGGIVALNQPIDMATAEALTQTFLECVVAPGCSPEAQDILAKKKNLRVLLLSDLTLAVPEVVKPIAGGVLIQAVDNAMELPDRWQVVTEKAPSPSQEIDLLFAWKVVKHVKSNAIVLAKGGVTLGVGAGQMNRVGSVAIALEQSGDATQGAVLASDAFFPFDDSVRTAAAAGITAIIQPGGSIRDQDSIAAANELGLTMVFTGVRHFLH